MPVTRFFFPESSTTATKSNKSNPFFQYFDVTLSQDFDVPQDAPSARVPDWAPDAYHSLSFMKANSKAQLQSAAPLSQELLCREHSNGVTINSFDSAQWITDMNFCKWVSRLRPRTYTDGEPCAQLMGGVIQWLTKQLVEAQQLIHGNVARQAAEQMASEKSKLWGDYHTLRLEDEGRLRAQLEQDKLQHLKLAEEIAIKEKGGEIRKVELESAKLLSRLEEMQFDKEQLKKAVSDTHQLARKYEDMMNKEIGRHEDTQRKVEMLENKLDHLKAILEKARRGAIRRTELSRGEAIWQSAVDAVADLTPATSSYVAKVVNIGIHDGSASKRVKLLTLTGDDPSMPEPHFKYIAASSDDHFMVGRTMLQGQGVSFVISEEGGPREIFVKSAKENREVYFFKGEVRSGSYFGLGLQYLKRQMVAVLGADTCGGTEVLEVSLSEMDKEFIRMMGRAAEAALAKDEQETEIDMDPQSRLLQMMGATPASQLEKSREDLQAMRDVLSDGMQLQPSDLAEMRSLQLAPPHSFCVIKAAYFLAGYQEEDFSTWQEARLLLTQEFVSRLKRVQPEDVSNAVTEWKMALLELCHVKRTNIRNESPAALIIYKWILALRAATGALCSKRRDVKAELARKSSRAEFRPNRTEA